MRQAFLRIWLVGGYLLGFAVVYAGARISLERFWPGVAVSGVGLAVIGLTVAARNAARSRTEEGRGISPPAP